MKPLRFLHLAVLATATSEKTSWLHLHDQFANWLVKNEVDTWHQHVIKSPTLMIEVIRDLKQAGLLHPTGINPTEMGYTLIRDLGHWSTWPLEFEIENGVILQREEFPA